MGIPTSDYLRLQVLGGEKASRATRRERDGNFAATRRGRVNPRRGGGVGPREKRHTRPSQPWRPAECRAQSYRRRSRAAASWRSPHLRGGGEVGRRPLWEYRGPREREALAVGMLLIPYLHPRTPGCSRHGPTWTRYGGTIRVHAAGTRTIPCLDRHRQPRYRDVARSELPSSLPQVLRLCSQRKSTVWPTSIFHFSQIF